MTKYLFESSSRVSETLYKNNLYCIIPIIALLAILAHSPHIQALDITSDTNTSALAQNESLNIINSATLTVDNNYNANGLDTNFHQVIIDTTGNGNTFETFSTYGDGNIGTSGSGSISLGWLGNLTNLFLEGTGELSFEPNMTRIGQIFVNNESTITTTGTDAVDIRGMTVNSNTTLECNYNAVFIDELNIHSSSVTLNLITNVYNNSLSQISGNGTLNLTGGSWRLNGMIGELSTSSTTTISPDYISCSTLDIDANTTISHNLGKVITVYNKTEIANGTTLTITYNGTSTLAAIDLSGTLINNGTGTTTITTINAGAEGNAKLDGTGSATVNNLVTLNNNLQIAGSGTYTFDNGISINPGSTLTINGSGNHVLNNVTLAGELANNDSNLPALSSLTIASGTTGTLSGTAGTAITTANINGTHNYTANADTTYTTANIAGTLNQNSANTLSLTNLNIANGNTATLNVNNGTLGVNTITNNGTMNFSIAKTGRLTNNSGSAINLSLNNSTLTLDFGDDSNTAIYAQTTGSISSAGTATGGIDTVESIFAVNGVDGITYANVFTSLTDGTNNFGDDDLLSTSDRLRTYKLANNGTGVTVSINTPGIRSEIINNGGSEQTADGLVKMVKKQGSMSEADSTYVTTLTRLQGRALTRATQQTEGQEATTGTLQTALQGVLGSNGAVSNQLISFRSGSISAGMSSFSSGGATSALSDMADADTLAEAYETGFTSPSDTTVYHKINIWANGYGGFGEQGSAGELTGYDFWNLGTMIGLDYAFAEELRIGALLGYSYNKTTGYEDFGISEDNVIRVGAYSSFNWDNFFVDISPTTGIHLIDSQRNIWNGSTAIGKRTGIDFNIESTVGYTFNLPNEFQITPRLSIDYTMFYDPKFSESGAGSANIDYNSFTSNSLIQDLGVKVGKLLKFSETLAFLPEAWAGWEIEYLNTGGTRNTVNVGQNFQTNLNSMATHRAYWGAGLTALINENISVYGRYDHKVWDKGYNVSFSTGVKISF